MNTNRGTNVCERGEMPSLGRLLHRVDGVAATIRKCYDLGTRILRSRQKFAEVAGVEGMARLANDFTAGRLHGGARIFLHRPPERIVGRYEIPSIEAKADQCPRHADGVRIGVVGPMETGLRAIFAGEIAAAARNRY